MSKNQEDNATFTNEKTTEEQRNKHGKFLASLEKSRAELEEKSVEEIEKLDMLDLAKYFCDDYLLITKHQKQSQIYSDLSNLESSSEELKHKAYIYLDEHTKPDMNKFISTFNILRVKTLNLSETEMYNAFTTLEVIKNKLRHLPDSLDYDEISNLKSSVGNTLSNIVIRYGELLGSSYNRTTFEETNLAEEQSSTDNVSDETLPEVTMSFNISEQLQTLDNNIQVSTTGSSSLSDDDIV
ncbi:MULTISPECIES: hypothetical protein [unclassified Candidatus Tisiphia]|uniref:hypothetical protein n=1 Tax=unclassified Candidatus Tisiphia TaxID=2996318 RepID=UPI00312C7077